jgi:manganese/zinc/iron transport system ATP- binding protein
MPGEMQMKRFPALKVCQLTVNYEKTPVLWDLTLEVPEGKLVGIVGPNGAGKSTFLKTILGLQKPISGRVEFFGQSLQKMRHKISYVPQKESVDWDFPIQVIDLVLMGSYGKLGLFKRPTAIEKKQAWMWIEKVGMQDFAKRQIDELSGGQKQRAFLARALMQKADIYFMDEPFSGIDMASTQIIFQLLGDLQKEGKTLFIVHHDLNTLQTIFDWAILLNMHLVACGDIKSVLTKEYIDKAYGTDKKMLEEVARLAQGKMKGYP